MDDEVLPLLDQLRGVASRGIFARNDRVDFKLTIHGYEVVIAVAQERAVLSKFDSRLPRAPVEALLQQHHELHAPTDLPWVFHNLRSFIELVAARKRFFTDALLEHQACDVRESVLSANEKNAWLRLLIVPNAPTATSGASTPSKTHPTSTLMLIIAWTIGFDATGKVTSQLRVHLSCKTPLPLGFPTDIDAVFHALLSHASMSMALRTLVNRLQCKCN